MRPSDEDVQEVLRRIVRRMRRLLRPRLELAQADARAPDALSAAQADSVSLLRGGSPHPELLLRVFREDVLVCPCAGRRVVLAFITEEKVVKQILEHLGLPTTGPPVAPARIVAAGEENPWQDGVPELRQTLR
jgi:hypothetical protein